MAIGRLTNRWPHNGRNAVRAPLRKVPISTGTNLQFANPVSRVIAFLAWQTSLIATPPCPFLDSSEIELRACVRCAFGSSLCILRSARIRSVADGHFALLECANHVRAYTSGHVVPVPRSPDRPFERRFDVHKAALGRDTRGSHARRRGAHLPR